MIKHIIDNLLSIDFLIIVVCFFFGTCFYNFCSSGKIVGYYPGRVWISANNEYADAVCASIPWDKDECHVVNFSKIDMKKYIDDLNSTIVR